jgi:hypothetical protein
VLAGILAGSAWGSAFGVDELAWLDPSNVAWDSPSKDSFGSMPLGNGDIGLNVWIEPNGDLLFYVSKVDAFDANHLLPKLGRVRLRLEPALGTNEFRQTLVLRDGAIEVKAGDVDLRVWVDANSPVIRVQGACAAPRGATISVEALRPLADANAALPGAGTAGVLFTNAADRLAWCYRNQSSAWANNFKSQNTPEMVAKTKDPILYRTSGCVLWGQGFTRESPTTLRLKERSKEIDCSVRVLSSQPENVQVWLAETEKPVKADWPAHQAYWHAFWDRSRIVVTGCGEAPVNLDQCRFTQFAQGSKAYEGHKEIAADANAFQLSQRYALERFCQAAASRGVVPPPYNGSIFTMDMPAGVLGFDAPKGGPVLPDGRDWANLSFMWQNTRHPYWSMATRGDFDTLRPGMQFVRDGLDIARDRCKKIFGFEGAFIMEASWWHNVGVFNWDGMPGHLRYHQIASVETPAIMCEYYEHTRDRTFLDEVLLPCADEFIAYYANRFTTRDAKGKMLMAGVGCAETYQGVDNPCTEIGCLKFLMTKLLSFEINAERRQRWAKLLGEMPGVPTRRIRGLDLLAVGDRYDPGRTDCETPELYSVYPFRQVWLGQPALLANARQSFHVRNISLDGTVDAQSVETGGWQSAPVQAAYLGLPREAARLASINFNDRFIHWNDNVNPGAPWPERPRARFPAFWECKMDGTPDNDHGANSVNALQSMLLQSDGNKILLLPAWPEDWDVSFKLCAPGNTAVECEYRDGKVQSLKVTPKSRKADVVDLSSLENRVRTLVGVACADRNYLFGLPPMLDGLPKPGKTTGPWLKKYGESLTGTKAGPWAGCVFRGNIVYQHRLGGPVELPEIPAKLISQTYLTGKDEKPDTIIKLEYDRPVEEFAMAAPSQGSFTAGRQPVNGELDLGQPAAFDRVEFTIDNPTHKRGEGKPFELQVKQPDGSWRTVHKGLYFGTIYSKRFEPVTARFVRLNVGGAGVRQFDLFLTDARQYMQLSAVEVFGPAR